MSAPLRRLAGIAAAGALILLGAGCPSAPPAPNGEKRVDAQPIAPYDFHEECFHLERGERVEFAFGSDTPVKYNIHYHDAGAIVMPRTGDDVREDAAIYVAAITQDYCLMWEAGQAGAIIHYRLRLRPKPA